MDAFYFHLYDDKLVRNYFGTKSLYSTIGVHIGVGNWKLLD